MSDPLSLRMELAYAHGLGEMAPFFDALLEGRLMASRCPSCGEIRCPPCPRCPTDGAATALVELPGTGRLRAETLTTLALPFAEGPPGPMRFVLVALDGASGLTLGRMADPEKALAPGARLRFAPPAAPPPHPAQALVFRPES